MHQVLMSDDENDPHYRLRIDDGKDDGTGLFTLSEEEIYPSRPHAEAKACRAAIDLTPRQAEWLLGALSHLLASGGAHG